MLLPLHLLALTVVLTRPVPAQHGGVAATLNFTQYDDRVAGRSASARGFGFEGVAGDIGGNSLYASTSLDFYSYDRNGGGEGKFGVWNVGVRFWPNAFEPGLRPWIGGGIGLGGGDRQITPVVLGGVSWLLGRARWPAKGSRLVPFVAAEYATKYERTRFKVGLLLGG